VQSASLTFPLPPCCAAIFACDAPHMLSLIFPVHVPVAANAPGANSIANVNIVSFFILVSCS
jgi:hypothetical protein